jgi:hypothetical protein
MFSVILESLDNINTKAGVENLIKVLGIKRGTASQLISNLPLKVYNNLSSSDAKVMVEALNTTTLVIWRVVVTNQSDLPKVNWNKEPLILGKSIADIKMKNNPKLTGVAMLELESEFHVKNDSSGTSASFSDVSQTVLRGLGEGLDAAIQTKDTISETNTTSQTYQDDLENNENRILLKPGFYNLFLPALKSKNSKKIVEELCREILEWDTKSIKNALLKPIVCVAKDVDHVEGSQIIDEFEKHGILLNKKLVTKI